MIAVCHHEGLSRSWWVEIGDMVCEHAVIWGLPRGQRLLPKMLLCVLSCVITLIVQARPILLVRKTIISTQNIHGAPGDCWLQLDVTGWLQISSSPPGGCHWTLSRCHDDTMSQNIWHPGEGWCQIMSWPSPSINITDTLTVTFKTNSGSCPESH